MITSNQYNLKDVSVALSSALLVRLKGMTLL